VLNAAQSGQVWAMTELAIWHLFRREKSIAYMWFACAKLADIDTKKLKWEILEREPLEHVDDIISRGSLALTAESFAPYASAIGSGLNPEWPDLSRSTSNLSAYRHFSITNGKQRWARRVLASQEALKVVLSCRSQAFNLATKSLLSGTLSFVGALLVIRRLIVDALSIRNVPMPLLEGLDIAQRNFLKSLRLFIVTYWTIDGPLASSRHCTPPPNCVLDTVHALAAAKLLDEDVFILAIRIMRRWAEPLDDAQQIAKNRHCPGKALGEFRDDIPRVLWCAEHWVILYKPCKWAVSWCAKIRADMVKVERTWVMTQGGLSEHRTIAPLDCDLEPFGPGDRQARPRDLLFWLLRTCEQLSINTLPVAYQQHPIQADRCLSYGVSHRLDAQTSGPLIVARSYWGWAWLQLLFRTKRVAKHYVCLCDGLVKLAPGTLISWPLIREAIPGRVSMRSIVSCNGMGAVTEIAAVAHLLGPHAHMHGSGPHRHLAASSRKFSTCSSSSHPNQTWYSLVEIRLWTGRLHQIRVHMAAEGHPLVSDVLYGAGRKSWCPRFFLHCFSLCFRCNLNTPSIKITCQMPGDLRRVLSMMDACDELSHNLLLSWSGRGGTARKNDRVGSRFVGGRWLGRVTRDADGRGKRPGFVKFRSNDRFYTVPFSHTCIIQDNGNIRGSLVHFHIFMAGNEACAIDLQLRA